MTTPLPVPIRSTTIPGAESEGQSNLRLVIEMKTLFILLSAFCFLLSFSACPHAVTPPTPPVPVTLGPTEIWLTPDIGSPDLLAMFAHPEQWQVSRAKVKVWKWYTQQLLTDACPICGPNTLKALEVFQSPLYTTDVEPKPRNVFEWLQFYKIQQAVEVAAIKEWGCTAAVTMPVTQRAIDAVNHNGGAVAWLNMDEPLYAATTTYFLNPATTQRCGMSIAQAQSQVAAYIAGTKQANFGVKVGDIEPYPALSATQLAAWIASVPIDSFDLDTDTSQIPNTFAADLWRIDAACKVKGIPFGIIFAGEAPAGVDFITNQKAFMARVLQVYRTPDRSIFQSWAAPYNIPPNVPETTPGTMTNAILGATQ